MAEKEKQKFVVYQEKLGRLQSGIYSRYVKIVGNMAFVLHEGNGRQADVLPAANVFNSLEEAKKYLAGVGKEMWVVREESRRDLPEMFKGRVIMYTHENYNGPRARNMLVMRPDGTTFIGNYGLRVYSNKKEAESDYASRWHLKFKEAKKELREYSQLCTDLMKIKPRSKKKHILLQGEKAIAKEFGG